MENDEQSVAIKFYRIHMPPASAATATSSTPPARDTATADTLRAYLRAHHPKVWLVVSDAKGELVTARPVREGQHLLLVSRFGQVIRFDVSTVRRTGRSTEGVRLMNIADDDMVCRVAEVGESSPEEEAAADEADAVVAEEPPAE